MTRGPNYTTIEKNEGLVDHSGAAVVLAVGSQTALSAAPQTLTVRDKTGDAFGHGTIQPRPDVDIRSVTLTRPGKRKLIVVVETVTPLRPNTGITFRYAQPGGFEEIFVDATLTTSGAVLVYAGDLDRRGIVSIPGGSVSGRRFTLVLDTRSTYLEGFPRFIWMVSVVAPDPASRRGIRDHVPHQVDAVVAPRFARFP